MHPGQRIRRFRVAKGLTQRELAAPRYTSAYVSTIETGRRSASRSALEHFAAKLDVDVEELLTGRSPRLLSELDVSLNEARVCISAGRLDEAGRRLRQAIRQAKRFESARHEARAHEIWGLLLERQGRPQEALARFESAERLLAAEPLSSRVEAVAGQARCFEALGDVRYAIHLLESFRARLERCDMEDPDTFVRVGASLVYAYLEAGLLGKADRIGQRVLEFAPNVTDPLRLAQMHIHVARLHLRKGALEDAKRSLVRAEDLYVQLGLRTELGGAHLARGFVLAREGRLADARAQLERARSIFEETKNAKDEARALNELAAVARLDGRAHEAVSLLRRAISLAESDTPELARAHREAGLTLAPDDPAEAEKHFRTAVELYERADHAIDAAVTYGHLADLLAEGNPAAAIESYRCAMHALERVNT